MSQPEPAPARRTPRYGGYVGLLVIVILVLITINTIVTKPNGVKGLAPGERMPPFAVPLALGSLTGDADTARNADEGSAGRVPACKERGPQILNACQLYEGAPVVLALFVDGGSCPSVLREMQALSHSFPGVRFAAVAIKNSHAQIRKLIRSRGLTMPVGLDSDGALAALYKVATCPQVTFAYPGGEVQSKALLTNPGRAALRQRVSALVAASRARGWKPPHTAQGAGGQATPAHGQAG
jgi:AhpC/TSA family